MAAPAMPSALIDAARREGREAWLATIPEAVAELTQRWSLEVGDPFQPGGQTAWVAPVTRGGEELVLKVGWRHPEARDEAAGLRAWQGGGAVLLHEAIDLDADTIGLLL